VEVWVRINGYEAYSVSEFGRVRNEETGRVLTVLRNPHGTCYVGMMKDGTQRRRSIARLVGKTFVPPLKRYEHFEDLIHRDNDLTNNRADNLMWRPHWFLVAYLLQAKHGKEGGSKPVIETKTQERYANTWEAALAFGLLERDIISSIINRTYTFPTFQEFRYIAE
jgi:hypothetical protein